MKVESIKFKAKRLDNGEWIIGSLIRSTAGVKERAYIVDNFSSMSDYSIVGVDPSTICQFTGLKDCKGNEVWEGDIIKSPYLGNLATVEWDNSLCGFKCVDDRRLINYSLRALVESSGWSLIGNKFDKEK